MARRPSISRRYPVEGEDKTGQSILLPDRPFVSRPRSPHDASIAPREAAEPLPSLSGGLRWLWHSCRCLHTAWKIPIFEAKNRPSNCAFATALNRVPGALKNHQKILFIQ